MKRYHTQFSFFYILKGDRVYILRRTHFSYYCVLAISGCSNKTHRLVLQTEIQISWFWRPASLRPSQSRNPVSGEVAFLDHRWCLLTVSSRAGRGEAVLWALFDEGSNPTHEGPPHDPSASPKSYLLVLSCQVLRLQQMNLGRTQTFRCQHMVTF